VILGSFLLPLLVSASGEAVTGLPGGGMVRTAIAASHNSVVGQAL
jgi:hypothetical protein